MIKTPDSIDPKHLDKTTGGGPVSDAVKKLGEGLPFPRKDQPKRPCVVCGLG